MHRQLKVAYCTHSLRSDWNNGNAHFLRGLMRAMTACGHDVVVYEPCTEWSIEHLRKEKGGEASLAQYGECYRDVKVTTYAASDAFKPDYWRSALGDREIVILHEWNPPALAHLLLKLHEEQEFRLLFHDTHHRASSSPEQIRRFGIERFDGVLCFGESLRRIYQDRFGIVNAWTMHEAADTTVFRPRPPRERTTDVVWIGNWGDGERSRELREFLLEPSAALRKYQFLIYGVRYPAAGLEALQEAGVHYGGYLPNLEAPAVYSAAPLTVHIPRQQYTAAMIGIPTIRVFEALACGIPLISAPWTDSEQLFREGDFLFVKNGAEMRRAIRLLLEDKDAAAAQALRGLETILSRHTCQHRAEELTCICEEVLR